MTHLPRYATLMDGAFVIHKIAPRVHRFPTALDIEAVSNAIAQHRCVSGLSRLRVYFYHSRPAAEVVTNPISKHKIALSKTRVHAAHAGLLKDLEIRPDFALRLGELHTVGWKVGATAFRRLLRQPDRLEAEDLVPAIEQKGVDLRIGLDIAKLSLTRAVEAIVVVTGDSDLVPALKFARREGVRVFLCNLGHGVRRDLRAHADRIIRLKLPCSIAAAVDEVDEAA